MNHLLWCLSSLLAVSGKADSTQNLATTVSTCYDPVIASIPYTSFGNDSSAVTILFPKPSAHTAPGVATAYTTILPNGDKAVIAASIYQVNSDGKVTTVTSAISTSTVGHVSSTVTRVITLPNGERDVVLAGVYEYTSGSSVLTTTQPFTTSIRSAPMSSVPASTVTVLSTLDVPTTEIVTKTQTYTTSIKGTPTTVTTTHTFNQTFTANQTITQTATEIPTASALPPNFPATFAIQAAGNTVFDGQWLVAAEVPDPDSIRAGNTYVFPGFDTDQHRLLTFELSNNGDILRSGGWAAYLLDPGNAFEPMCLGSMGSECSADSTAETMACRVGQAGVGINGDGFELECSSTKGNSIEMTDRNLFGLGTEDMIDGFTQISLVAIPAAGLSPPGNDAPYFMTPASNLPMKFAIRAAGGTPWDGQWLAIDESEGEFQQYAVLTNNQSQVLAWELSDQGGMLTSGSWAPFQGGPGGPLYLLPTTTGTRYDFPPVYCTIGDYGAGTRENGYALACTGANGNGDPCTYPQTSNGELDVLNLETAPPDGYVQLSLVAIPNFGTDASDLYTNWCSLPDHDCSSGGNGDGGG